jgi:ATP-dependent DNA ligase
LSQIKPAQGIVANELRHRCDFEMREMPTNIQELVERSRPAAVELPTRLTRFSAAFSYLCSMRKCAFDPCIPTRGTKVPDRPEWLHEIKHDGYRLIVQREGKTVRLWTRKGYDWSSRYPRIVEAALGPSWPPRPSDRRGMWDRRRS